MEPERTVIGVDIGGTKIAAARLRGRLPAPGARSAAEVGAPRILERHVLPTDTASAQACLDGIIACIGALGGGRAPGETGGPAGGGPAEAIGVGVASMVDFARGRAVASVNLPLNDVPLRDVLRERFGVPVVVDNDANVAALGEHLYGAGVGAGEMLMLTLGTGVGGGIICGGRLFRGSSGAAAELGHIVIDSDGPTCPAGCPNHGCLEAYVAGPAIGAAALAAAQAQPGSALGRALAASRAVDGPLLTELGQDGDPVAIAVLTRVGEYLGVGLTTLVNIFNPELVVVGGGAAAAGELLLEPARRVLAARALAPARDQVRVVPAALGADAGFIGAAALALAELAPASGPFLTSPPPYR